MDKIYYTNSDIFLHYFPFITFITFGVKSPKIHSVFALIFFTYLPKSQIQKKIIFIQTNSFIIFTCSIPVLLVPDLGEVG